MKRKLEGKQYLKTPMRSIRADISDDQLAEIGAAILAFNDAEGVLDLILSEALDIPDDVRLDVVTRFNGIDGKVEIIRRVFSEHFQIDQPAYDRIDLTLSAFLEFKKYRDAIAHARIVDRGSNIGEVTKQRGSVEQVLLSMDALSGLYDRLVLMRDELLQISGIIEALHVTVVARWRRAVDQERRLLVEAVQEHLARLLRCQKDRQSLKPLPKFPDQPPIPKAKGR